jgi:hypothetical protein
VWRLTSGNKEQYSKAKHQIKYNVTGEVLDGILETGSHFLKQVEGEEYWEEATHLAALDKVSHTIGSKC